MPYVHLTMLDRGPEKKRAAVKAVTGALAAACEVPPDWVHVIVTEINSDQCAVGGRLLADMKKRRAHVRSKRRAGRKEAGR